MTQADVWKNALAKCFVSIQALLLPDARVARGEDRHHALPRGRPHQEGQHRGKELIHSETAELI